MPPIPAAPGVLWSEALAKQHLPVIASAKAVNLEPDELSANRTTGPADKPLNAIPINYFSFTPTEWSLESFLSTNQESSSSSETQGTAERPSNSFIGDTPVAHQVKYCVADPCLGIRQSGSNINIFSYPFSVYRSDSKWRNESVLQPTECWKPSPQLCRIGENAYCFVASGITTVCFTNWLKYTKLYLLSGSTSRRVCVIYKDTNRWVFGKFCLGNLYLLIIYSFTFRWKTIETKAVWKWLYYWSLKIVRIDKQLNIV